MNSVELQVDMAGKSQYVTVVADIVAAYVSNNSLPLGDLAELIASVHQSITALMTGASATPVVAEVDLVPPVSIKKSLQHDFLISMEDGKRYKSLKRHIGTYGLTSDEYRAKWKLPRDYPMVAPAYSKARSELARASGLGIKSDMPKAEKLTTSKRGRSRKDATQIAA